MSIFASAKDRLMEQAALSFLNSQVLAPFGQATSLRMDSNAKTIRVELDLKGETAPVMIEITGYEVFNEGDRFFLSARSASTSREWLTALANAQLCGKRIEIPEQAGRWLTRML
ncbi:MAG: hypothetical protein H7Y43_03220 [Akkermansiaceae bacterium]|nr:hypothetical protein [Verrucomicrobiales bacterium]